MGTAYDGFISYSHAADGLLAPRLQAGLQRFAKPWWQRRALRIFRDESSLSANPHLWSSITEALDTSAWFVLLLSPDAAASEWVNQEVAYWVEHRDPDRIIPVVTAGEFGWDGDVVGSAVPEALQGVLSDEPRWADARGLGDPRTLDLKNPEFAAVVADLAAPLRGIPKDELASEEVRQHRRSVRTAWAAAVTVVVLAVAASAAALFALGQRDEAERQAAEAERQTGIATQALDAAEEQARLARLAQEEAVDEAARADRTADRLIDFVIRPEDPRGRGGFFQVPLDARPIAVPPTELPLLPGPPSSVRLDFQQESCRTDTCFSIPAFVRDDPPSRTFYDLDGGTIWLAGEPFHIRHGFDGVGATDLDEAIAAGYSVHAFVTRVVGPEGGRFEIDVPYRIEASAAVDVVTDACGPKVHPSWDGDGCVQWVLDFPDGMPEGSYQFGLEWTAPCPDWFEVDVCPVPRPVGLAVVGGAMSFLGEDFRSFQDRRDLGWPFDPWSLSEPIDPSS